MGCTVSNVSGLFLDGMRSSHVCAFNDAAAAHEIRTHAGRLFADYCLFHTHPKLKQLTRRVTVPTGPRTDMASTTTPATPTEIVAAIIYHVLKTKHAKSDL